LFCSARYVELEPQRAARPAGGPMVGLARGRCRPEFTTKEIRMSKATKMQTLSGSLQQLLYSPKGGLEGLLIAVRKKTIQVSMDPAAADAVALAHALGHSIEVTAEPDQSPKTKGAVHPVYKLDAIRKIAGKAFTSNGEDHGQVRGSVASIHYAKHGEANGVILDSGEFIHTRPHGMKKLKLRIGSKVIARGERRSTVLGTTLIEAREVNRVTIE